MRGDFQNKNVEKICKKVLSEFSEHKGKAGFLMANFFVEHISSANSDAEAIELLKTQEAVIKKMERKDWMLLLSMGEAIIGWITTPQFSDYIFNAMRIYGPQQLDTDLLIRIHKQIADVYKKIAKAAPEWDAVTKPCLFMAIRLYAHAHQLTDDTEYLNERLELEDEYLDCLTFIKESGKPLTDQEKSQIRQMLDLPINKGSVQSSAFHIEKSRADTAPVDLEKDGWQEVLKKYSQHEKQNGFQVAQALIKYVQWDKNDKQPDNLIKDIQPLLESFEQKDWDLLLQIGNDLNEHNIGSEFSSSIMRECMAVCNPGKMELLLKASKQIGDAYLIKAKKKLDKTKSIDLQSLLAQKAALTAFELYVDVLQVDPFSQPPEFREKLERQFLDCLTLITTFASELSQEDKLNLCQILNQTSLIDDDLDDRKVFLTSKFLPS